MIQLTDWLQDKWLELGSLLAQSAIAILLGWYGRKLLTILEFSHQGERRFEGRRRPVAAAAPIEDARGEEQSEPALGMGRRMAQWLQEPMTSRGTTPWRKLVRWLQAPAGS